MQRKLLRRSSSESTSGTSAHINTFAHTCAVPYVTHLTCAHTRATKNLSEDVRLLGEKGVSKVVDLEVVCSAREVGDLEVESC